jgi:hypothetical protein
LDKAQEGAVITRLRHQRCSARVSCWRNAVKTALATIKKLRELRGTVLTQENNENRIDPRQATPLALLAIPYIFTQDKLLTTDDFLRQAKDRGQRLTLDDLQKLHANGLIVPFYRVDDNPIETQRITVEPSGEMNVRGRVLEAAASGRLRDPEDEGYSDEWPYARPPGTQSGDWWNCYAYSSWQLLDLGDAINALKSIELFGPRPDEIEAYARSRRIAVALAALSPRYLPAVIGKFWLPPSADASGYWQFRADSDPANLLSVAGFNTQDLRQQADDILFKAHNSDPLVKWIKLLRYASFSGWTKLRGEPLNAMWRRVAAELLLHAHEDLAAGGALAPLPDLTDSVWEAPQHDRLTPRYPEAETLERALADFGLSPHPRVILLVEGETELVQIPRLLAEFGLTQPQQVRVQRTKGSKVNTQLITRYGVTPRIGRRVNDHWLLDATPTALLIAMDAENKWATAAGREQERRKLQDAVREEVRAQGADITQDDLDFLIRVRVWGDDSYEFANFTDDELVAAVAQFVANNPNHDTSSPAWQQALRTELLNARQQHLDIKIPLGRMRIPDDKVALAEILWPVLLAKCEKEWAADRVETPVLKVIMEVRDLDAQLAGGRAIKVPPDFDARYTAGNSREAAS